MNTLHASLSDTLRAGDLQATEELLNSLSPAETARVISKLDEEDRVALLELLEPDGAADVLEDLPVSQAADIIEDLDPDDAADILEELHDDDRADLLGDLDDETVAAILEEMEDEEASQARHLMTYDEESAGGLMTTEFLSFHSWAKVRDVIFDLRANARDYEELSLQYVYVTDAEERCIGVLRMRDLVLAPDDQAVTDVMIREPVTMQADVGLNQLLDFFDENEFIGLPVVDSGQRMLGVVLRADVEEAGADRVSETFLKASGIVGGEELRSMPLHERSTRRLSWLSVNVLLNLLGAGVIAMHQDTLQEAIALAVFLPVISDMSGCSGNQAVAVSIRELSLGLLRPHDLRHVLGKEISIGIINGVVLGMLIAGIALLWKGNPWLGLVVGAALAINTCIAVCLGGGLPLVLKKMGRDPALASGPILTTVTDVCGFFLVLSLANLFLSKLV